MHKFNNNKKTMKRLWFVEGGFTIASHSHSAHKCWSVKFLTGGIAITVWPCILSEFWNRNDSPKDWMGVKKYKKKLYRETKYHRVRLTAAIKRGAISIRFVFFSRVEYWTRPFIENKIWLKWRIFGLEATIIMMYSILFHVWNTILIVKLFPSIALQKKTNEV